jgi:hypothetical protein
VNSAALRGFASAEIEDEVTGAAAAAVAVAPTEKAPMVLPFSSVKTGSAEDTTEEDTGATEAMDEVVRPGAMEGDDELAGKAEEKSGAEAEVDEGIATAEDGGAALEAGSLVLVTTTEEERALENPGSDAVELGGAELDLGRDLLLVDREVTDPTAVFDRTLVWRLSTLELEGAELRVLVGGLDDEDGASLLDRASGVAGIALLGGTLLGATLLGTALFNTALFAATLLALNDAVELDLNVLSVLTAVSPG